MKSISQSVGIRNGVNMPPNKQCELDTITDLLDGVSAVSGGTLELLVLGVQNGLRRLWTSRHQLLHFIWRTR